MALDAQQAALLVRVTARVSAVVVAANIIIATRRAVKPGSPALRRMDVGTFLAFLTTHTIHFICVLLLAAATEGDNIRNAGGWLLVAGSAVAFYVGAAVVLRLKLRPAFWRSPAERRVETVLLVVVWLVFFQAYALRFLQSWLFAALALLLVYSVAGLLRVALRSEATSISS